MKLETNRLYIRNLYEADWQKMKSIFIDFNNSKYAVYDVPLPIDDEETRALTKKFAESNLFFAVFLKESDNMLGYVCFHKDKDKYDLGYCFHSTYHLNGYAYESTKALIEYLVDEHNVVNFTAGAAIDNIPSCRLLEKLGFVCASIETISFNKAFAFQGGNFVLTLKRTNHHSSMM
ncbi:MAG: GNAT family N-acetyltransferase [Ruminococcus sp.]|nr:GNAT family N-acetyltransferase [Ruminococcus sp.]